VSQPTGTERLHILEGTQWKDAVIKLLEPRCPYRPWRHGFGEAHQGDPVAVVLNTDPVSVLTTLGRIGVDRDPAHATIDMRLPPVGLIDLATLVMVVGMPQHQDPRHEWLLEGDAAVQLELALTECRFRDDPLLRFGHTSLAAARILLHSRGVCAGCGNRIDLRSPAARDLVHIHAVDAPVRQAPESPATVRDDRPDSDDEVEPMVRPGPPRLLSDWPGMLCRGCQNSMEAVGHRSLVDFRFAQHPECPRCGARRSQRARFGMLASFDIPPWMDARGCCVTADVWTCTQCRHTW
jgi:hypothetical protein